MNHLFGQELLKYMGNYKFFIAIENAVCNDYMTEKLWRAIQVGTVPIYFGSPLIRDWLPNNKSAILLEDFPTPELLSQHLHYLLNNDTAYEEYLEHKTLGIISNQKLIDEITSRPFQTDLAKAAKAFECFICEKVHNKSKTINIVTKKHYDCQTPTSALTLSVNPKNPWLQFMKQAKSMVDQTYREIWDPNTTYRQTNTRWWYFWG
ncbi:alpha-(1,3)-fucosyltransferase 11-like [Pectinophora gossypiella]|uniref:alpha-(1,3)-fucosyltransferase 11-like n=1 Tax=Pectinophora gossypiella TaxID=13191 RepID=UPI00214E7347|nr:alpha-(1,3)-fucosyltransferase 11-like [Pectinophora gossypiella]